MPKAAVDAPRHEVLAAQIVTVFVLTIGLSLLAFHEGGRPGVQTETAASTRWEGSAGAGHEHCSGYRFSVALVATTELV